MRPDLHADRRTSRRRLGPECAWLTHARLRHGLEVAIVDLATGGALVEAAARLLPGSSVELHLTAPGWQWSAMARVLRCRVSALLPERGVRYRAALRFDRPLAPPDPWQEESPTCDAARVQANIGCSSIWRLGSCYPSGRAQAPGWEATTPPPLVSRAVAGATPSKAR